MDYGISVAELQELLHKQSQMQLRAKMREFRNRLIKWTSKL